MRDHESERGRHCHHIHKSKMKEGKYQKSFGATNKPPQTVHDDHFVGIKLIHNLLCISKRHKVSRVVFFSHQKTPSIWSSLIICVRYGDNIQLICKPMFCPQPAAILSKCSMNDDVHKIIAQKNSVPCVWLNWPFIRCCVVCHIFGCC